MTPTPRKTYPILKPSELGGWNQDYYGGYILFLRTSGIQYMTREEQEKVFKENLEEYKNTPPNEDPRKSVDNEASENQDMSIQRINDLIHKIEEENK